MAIPLSPIIDDLIELALREDLTFGDITSELSIDASVQGTARLLIKEDIILCGMSIVERIAARFQLRLVPESHIQDGLRIAAGTVVGTLHGALRDLLSAERTMLNFLQRMSGVATYTAQAVAQSSGIIVLDTRKTIPGWRLLDKYAVRIGGGSNHRMSLGDMVLIKDNHIDANGGDIAKTLTRVFAKKAPYVSVEVEVRTIDELRVALGFPVRTVMLDNMDDSRIAEAVQLCRQLNPSVAIEASGSVRPERLAALSKLGVHAVSMGALTNRAPCVDISMKVVIDRAAN